MDVILGVQYYRPPFPDRSVWAEDLERIKSCGFNTVQLWACWGWIEANPGRYIFDDYDELIQQSKSSGLQVILSTVAEIHPFWIHRLVPDASMVDHLGRRVVSSLRRECQVGLTPGGCTDHPLVRDHMERFLRAIAIHYQHESTVVAWDAWNETRWAVQADGHVCYCDATLKAFREFLRGRYGDLASLNMAWKRRYAAWEDVGAGKLPGRPYTEMMEFQRFLTQRAQEHAEFRYQTLRREDDVRPIVAHCARPVTWSSGVDDEQALSRGHDFELAEIFDGFGSSHFPAWESLSFPELGTRLESTRSAVGSKPMWISELQGGSARNGLMVAEPVEASLQQRWIWDGLARGAKAIILWCWRDEVFGRESSGFGFNGYDGRAPDRIAAMKETSHILSKLNDILVDYVPDSAKIGLLFERSNYYLEWAQYGNERTQAQRSLVGYGVGFERIQVPYQIVDSHHLEPLAELKLLIVPWPLVVREEAFPEIFDWVAGGGTLVVESEFGAFDELGFYRDPMHRFMTNQLGYVSMGRRPVSDQEPWGVPLLDRRFALKARDWQEVLTEETPMRGSPKSAPAGMTESVSRETDPSQPTSEPHVFFGRVGLGQVLALGSFLGAAYADDPYPAFEDWLKAMVGTSQANPEMTSSIHDGAKITFRHGTSKGTHVLILMNHEAHDSSVRFTVPAAWVHGVDSIRDLKQGVDLAVNSVEAGTKAFACRIGGEDFSILLWEPQTVTV